MHAIIEFGKKKYAVNLHQPLDISIPMHSGAHNPNAFGIQPPSFEPFRAGGFIGSVAMGGSVNCENLLINAHGNGTHTECVGHISKEHITINQSLKTFFALAQLISIQPQVAEGGNVVKLEEVKKVYVAGYDALVIRTLPNDETKLTRHYSGNNPTFLEPALCAWLADNDIKHLLIDLPSVDPEEDGGALSAHHAFWKYPEQPRMDATITEMVFVPSTIKDGTYIINMQIASLETDASPSKPVLYAVITL
ncbi:MAG: cyclase family protein [Bacteroidota bacterium]